MAGAARRRSIDRRSNPDDSKPQLVKEVPQRRQSHSRKLSIDPSANATKVCIYVANCIILHISTC